MLKDKQTLQIDGQEVVFDVVSVNTLIIGAGSAGLKCAASLHDLGVDDVALVVDKLGNGTSNNSGSDKQTYYKMSVFGDAPDSPMEFARTLFKGGMMHGDLAYIEGLGSLPAFFELCRLGVPFPHNQYNGYVGYKTDHDPRQRGTSAGPKTSNFMFRKLLKKVQENGIDVFDKHEAVKLLTAQENGKTVVCGALCVNKSEYFQDSYGLTIFNARNVVMATGGPGEMYKISSWPHGQLGSHGLALEVGAVGNNLGELQYGLATTAHRWNVSGTYQQVVPNYYSTAADGVSDKRCFLHDYFNDMKTMATCIFLKGYQWPFHAERLQKNGSSLVDIAVHREIMDGRRVFMDLSENPVPAENMKPFTIEDMEKEGRDYLLRSGAVQDTPYQRLKHMNQPAIDLYLEHDIDLSKPVEVAVCAQHANGGLRGSIWWECSVPHLFAIGELNGTHGVRPGGSALNSGQVGATRAAHYIANVYRQPPADLDRFMAETNDQITHQHRTYTQYLNADDNALPLQEIRPDIQERMSAYAAFMRSAEGLEKALEEATDLYKQIERNGIRCASRKQLFRASEDRALALTSIAFIKTMLHYIQHDGGSRGGYMVLDENGKLNVKSKCGKELPHRPENLDKRQEILETSLLHTSQYDFEVTPVAVRPLPEDDSWFETTWADYQNRRIYQS